MTKSRGFTIIELIVVIAIIAVLAAIVLVNVTQYIAKGKNAAVEGNMATLLTNGAAYFDQNPSSVGLSFATNVPTGCGTGSAIQLAVGNANGVAAPAIKCFGDDTVANSGTGTQSWCGYAATIATSSSPAGFFCVDSTGYKGTTPAAPACAAAHYTCQ